MRISIVTCPFIRYIEIVYTYYLYVLFTYTRRCKRQGSKGTPIQEDFANPVTRMVLTVGQSAKWKHGVSTG